MEHPGPARPRRARPGSRPRLLRVSAGAALLSVVAGGTPAAGQDGSRTLGTQAAPAAREDSVALLGRAKEAQRRFEGMRRLHLPITFGGGSGPCDDRVGRMCWTHDTGGLWTPEPEAPRITAGREGLLADLADVAKALPGDEWVVGQRVWYLLEAGRPDEALAAARAWGGAPPWWCAALSGLALHMQGRYVEAEASFARALETMEPARARAWEDVRPIVDGDARGLIDAAGERGELERDARLRLLWRLSDPLHLVDGNDLRTEHLARRTVARIRADATNPHGIRWGDDLAELLVRYGWGVGWERIPPEPGQHPPTGRVIGHEHPESRSYIPPGSVLEDPAAAPADRWVPRLTYAPSAYAPAYAPLILPMESRVVLLSRGDHALVAATWAFPPDTTYRGRKAVRPEHRPPAAFEGASTQAGVFVAGVGDESIRSVRTEGSRRGSLFLEVPSGAHWISVEVLDPRSGRAGRFRRGLEVPDVPPDVARLSDLLLLEPGPLPVTVEEALGRLDPGPETEPGGSAVVAWEIWGLGWRAETIRYRLSLKAREGGIVRRLGRALGLVGSRRPHVLEWEEPGPDRPEPAFRSVRMDVPDVSPGEYLLRLEVTTPGRDVLVAEQEIRIGRGGPSEPSSPSEALPKPFPSPSDVDVPPGRF